MEIDEIINQICWKHFLKLNTKIWKFWNVNKNTQRDLISNIIFHYVSDTFLWISVSVFFTRLKNHWASNDFPWIRIEMMKSQWKLLLRFQWYWQNMLITDKVRDRENASIIMNWWQIQGIQITNCNMRNNVSAFLCVTSPLIGHSFFSHFLQFFSLCDSIHMDVLCGLWILRHIYQCNEYWK